MNGALAFIAGDRQSDGVFNLWSIGQNITIRSLKALRKAWADRPRGGSAAGRRRGRREWPSARRT